MATTVLRRTTLGRLASHAKQTELVNNVNTLFVVGNWTGFQSSGTATTRSVSNIAGLQVNINSVGIAASGAYYNALALPADHFILTARESSTVGGFQGAVARLKIASPAADFVSADAPINQSATYRITERLAGTNVQQVLSATANRTLAGDSRHGLWVRGNLATARQLSVAGTGVDDSTLDLTGLDAGTNGLYGGVSCETGVVGNVTIMGWSAMRSAILRVVGPDAGTWQVRLRNATGTLLYTSPSHTAGVVDINTLTEMTVLYSTVGMSPVMAQIEIYEPATATVLHGPAIPKERLWGGDVWDFTVPPTTNRTLTRTVLGRQVAYASYALLTNGSRGLDAFDTQDWEANNTASIVYDGLEPEVRGALRLSLSSSGSFSAYAVEAGANVADCYMQVQILGNISGGVYVPTNGDVRTGIVLRGSTPAPNALPTDAICVVSPGPASLNTSPANRAEIRERVSSVDVQTIRTGADVRPTTRPTRIHAVLTGSSITANNVGVSPSWSLSATGLTGPAGRPGLIGYNEYVSVRTMNVGGYYRCLGTNLIVNGPAAGTWYVELLDKDDNVLHTSLAQSGGQVIVDYEAADLLLPLTQKIRITDGVTPLVTVYPDNGVWPGDTWTYADTPPPSGIVTRTATGLVMARLANDYITTGLSVSVWNASEWATWTQLGGTSFFIRQNETISSYPTEMIVLTSSSNAAPNGLRRGIRWTGAAIPSDAFVVATVRIGTDDVVNGGSNTGVLLRSGTAPQTARVGGVVAGTNTSPQEHQLEERSAGVTVQTAVESGATQVNRRTRFALWVRGTLATFRAVVFRQVSGPDVVSETLTGLTTPAPTAGVALNFGHVISGRQSAWQSIAVMTSAEITMSGPSGGVWGLRVRDASGLVLAQSGANVAGVATLDTQVEMDVAYGRYSISTMRSIETYDTVTGDTLSDRLEPEGGIWGGDTFAVTALPPSGGYPASRLAHRKAGAARLLFKR
jgi:hypothetical protein